MKIGNLEVYGIIYKITNILNGKVYIGQTIQKNGFKTRYKMSGCGIEQVYKFHKSEKEHGRHYNKHLYKSIEKYGFKSFEVNKIFDIAFSKKELDIKEITWISIYNSNNENYGYNLTEGGSNMCDLGKRVICLNTLEMFDSIMQGARKYNIENTLRMHLSNPNRHKTAGIHPITNERLVWMYYEDYIGMTELEVEQYIKEHITIKRNLNRINNSKIGIKHIGKKIRCKTTNEVFCSIAEASRKYNFSQGRLTKKLKKGISFHSKHPITGEPLEWEYVI